MKSTYELWQSADGSYAFFDANENDVRDRLDDTAKLLWTVEADSWEEAQAKKHEYLGWEPYKPMGNG